MGHSRSGRRLQISTAGTARSDTPLSASRRTSGGDDAASPTPRTGPARTVTLSLPPSTSGRAEESGDAGGEEVGDTDGEDIVPPVSQSVTAVRLMSLLEAAIAATMQPHELGQKRPARLDVGGTLAGAALTDPASTAAPSCAPFLQPVFVAFAKRVLQARLERLEVYAHILATEATVAIPSQKFLSSAVSAPVASSQLDVTNNRGQRSASSISQSQPVTQLPHLSARGGGFSSRAGSISASAEASPMLTGVSILKGAGGTATALSLSPSSSFMVPEPSPVPMSDVDTAPLPLAGAEWAWFASADPVEAALAFAQVRI